MRHRANLIAGVACGALCVAGILSYAADLRASVEEERAAALSRYGGEQVEVFVATDDIAPGDMLDASNSEKRLWLSELVPDNAVFDPSEVASTPATSPIYTGEVVLRHRFDEKESVALQVPDGKCAVSVPAKSVSAVGGSVGPGSYVDVYAASGSATDLLVSRVLVLSTSTTAEEDEAGKADVTWVTLAVNPDAVAELITASQKSEVYFTLPSENSAVSTGEAAFEEAEAEQEADLVEADAPVDEAGSSTNEEDASSEKEGESETSPDATGTSQDAPADEEGTSSDNEDEH